MRCSFLPSKNCGYAALAFLRAIWRLKWRQRQKLINLATASVWLPPPRVT